MVKRGVLLGGAFVSVFAVSGAFGAEQGFFIGAGAGQSTVKAGVDSPGGRPIHFDETGDAYKAHAGFNFTRWFGIEGGYVQFGDTETHIFVPEFTFNPGDTGFGDPDAPPITVPATNLKAEIKPNGWQGFAVLYLPIGNFDLFAKVGGIVANIDVDATETALGITEHTSSSEGDSMLAYGAGAAYNFGHWAVRAEYEAYDVDTLDDLYAVTGSLQYTFFREK